MEIFKELIVSFLENNQFSDEKSFFENKTLEFLKHYGINIFESEISNTDDKISLVECVDILINNKKFNNLSEEYSKKYLSYIEKEQPKSIIEKYPYLSTYFNWEFDVNVFKLLGSQLISDKFTAIIELVKNSYDANATEVRIDFIDTLSEKGKIIITDNGLGMSKTDISSKWMRIGTNNKRKKTHTPEPFNRIYLGEKGIGRFAIEKLADFVTLESKEKDNDIIHKLTIDWSMYEKLSKSDNPQLFTSMLNKYERSNNSLLTSNNGTILTFENLKEEWTKQDIRRLKRELAKLVSPIQSLDTKYGFKIFVREELEKVLFNVNEYEEIINSSLSYATNKYVISFDNHIQEELHYNEETHEIEVLKTKIRNFGPVSIHIYYFNSVDKRKFKLAYNAKDLKIDGFKIYRDSILATPFVEIASIEDGIDTYRDILGIDKRRWSNFFGKISSHDFIGIIEITKKNNPEIKDLTNRQDFEDTKEYRFFKIFILEQLKQIEKKLEFEKIKLRNEEINKIKEAQEEVIDIKELLDSLVEKEPNLKDTISPMYSYLNNVSNALKISNKEIDSLSQTLERKEELLNFRT